MVIEHRCIHDIQTGLSEFIIGDNTIRQRDDVIKSESLDVRDLDLS